MAIDDPSARGHEPGGIATEGRQRLRRLADEQRLVRAGGPGDVAEALDRVHRLGRYEA